jgi:hypothetical protein
MSEIKKTISSIFMVPTLKIGKERLRVNGFINGYCKDGKQEIPYEDSCYVLFKPNRMEMFNQFLNEEYARTKTLIDDYDVDEGFVVLVYSLNSRYKADFDLIRQGRYSETSEEFQDQFDKVTKVVKGNSIKEETTLQWRIFNKAEDLKKYWEDRIYCHFTDTMEVWDEWSEYKETLDIERIKELI